MDWREIVFLSTKKRGLNPDLKLVKNYLFEKIENVSFKYFTSSEKAENQWARVGIKSAKKEYCKKLQDTICIDGSLPIKLPASAGEGHKILISTPYDYQFKAMNELAGNPSRKKKKTFFKCTDVIVGSPFGKELFEKCYQLQKANIVEEVCCPVAYEITQEESIQNIRKKFAKYFPQILNKKVLAIMVTGALDESQENPFANFDWRAFLKGLGDEWFVLTNDENLMENAIRLRSKYKESLGYVNQMLDAREMIYFADCLITNSSMYAAYFSTKRKPLYVIPYKDNEFVCYAEREFSDIFVSDVNKISELPIKEETVTDSHQRFFDYFSYKPIRHPGDVIVDILNN